MLYYFISILVLHNYLCRTIIYDRSEVHPMKTRLKKRFALLLAASMIFTSVQFAKAGGEDAASGKTFSFGDLEVGGFSGDAILKDEGHDIYTVRAGSEDPKIRRRTFCS